MRRGCRGNERGGGEDRGREGSMKWGGCEVSGTDCFGRVVSGLLGNK